MLEDPQNLAQLAPNQRYPAPLKDPNSESVYTLHLHLLDDGKAMPDDLLTPSRYPE
jgi:hypothetical protein